MTDTRKSTEGDIKKDTNANEVKTPNDGRKDNDLPQGKPDNNR